jgi:hypothetical protein
MFLYKRILTGSPVTKSPLDLFTQCYFLDPWLLDHQSYYTVLKLDMHYKTN